ncbi:DMT family transporter [Nordella sp. HKS 07]|uniref:DMT family transporter n=1 Tax=Nordella sp. HKS 07 TaxID=2712222 RepID=UPI0013E176FC|nr:DMT family transporter [Nordella sp. HKS 07]QIG48617.1 DMT family transporter [Nordella sp. HKS 07]
MPQHLQGYIYLTLAMATVGSTVIASKIAGSGLPPFTATALRLAMALPFFVILMRMTASPWPRPSGRDGVLLLLQATSGSVLYTALLISGLTYTSAANAGVIIGTLPVVSAAIAIIILGERPRPAVLFAIALAAAGVFAVAFEPGAGETSSLIGNVLIFAAILCEGLFILLNKRLRVPIEPLAQSTLMTGLGLAVALVPSVLEMPWTASPTPSSFWAVVYYAIVPTVGGYLLWYAGLARVAGAEAALFTAMAPVSAVLLAFLVLGETVSLHQLIGIGAVLLAVISLGFAQAKAS